MKEAVDAILVAEKEADAMVKEAQDKVRSIERLSQKKIEDMREEILQESTKMKDAMIERAKMDAEEESGPFLAKADEEIQAILHVAPDLIEETANKVVGRILYGNS